MLKRVQHVLPTRQYFDLFLEELELIHDEGLRVQDLIEYCFIAWLYVEDLAPEFGRTPFTAEDALTKQLAEVLYPTYRPVDLERLVLTRRLTKLCTKVYSQLTPHLTRLQLSSPHCVNHAIADWLEQDLVIQVDFY